MTTPNEQRAPINLAELERLAKAATAGPWRVIHEQPEFMEPYDAVVAADNNRSRCCIYTQDAHYIAAASPDVVLRLVAVLREMAREVNAASEMVAQHRCAEISDVLIIGPPASSLMAEHGITDEAGTERCNCGWCGQCP